MNEAKEWQFAFERSEMLREFQTELLVTISHELRNPISSQMGSLQMILSDLCDSPEEEREYVGSAKQSLDKLLHLLEEFTRLSRHHLPIQPLQTKPLALIPVLNVVQELVLLQAQDQGIQCHWPLLNDADSETLWVIADPHGLEQALLGVCRWSIRRLRYGSMTLTLGQFSQQRLHIELALWGRAQFPLDPDASTVWRVSRQLFQQMHGELMLLENSPEGLRLQMGLALAGTVATGV